MKVIILGNGVTGITAARTIRQNSEHAEITVISGETDHFFSRTALMYIYMGHMRFQDTKPYEDWFWDKNRINLKRAWISKIDFEGKKLISDQSEEFHYDKLVLATGSVPNKFGWPGQDLNGVHGMYSYQDLERLENRSSKIKHAVIVGGGLIGIELAEMLHSRHIPVTFLVRETSFWNNVLPPQESEMINRHINAQHGIDLRLNTELFEIRGDGQEVQSVVTNNGEEICCEFVGLTAGVRPNIDFLKETALQIDRGIMIDRSFITNIPDVYAGGDCAQFHNPPEGRRPVEQVWYTGKMHGEIIGKNIASGKNYQSYDPGPWFNSAKFFDIEYQTYGWVPPNIHDQENMDEIYWEHSDGMKSIHLTFRPSDWKFLGINSFGIRYRHQLFDKWLREERSIQYVLRNLKAANFDPEFFKSYEDHCIKNFNTKYPGETVRSESSKGLKSFLNLIKQGA